MCPRPPTRRRLLALAVALALAPGLALAQVAAPGPRFDEQFDFMNLLGKNGLHNLKDEAWNAYGQFTYVSSWKAPFPAKYTNLGGSTNSLSPDWERSFTGTVTVYLGLRLWQGGELYFVPEAVSERPFSGLHGLTGAIQNFELQKGGTETVAIYRSRLFLRQTFSLGGEPLTNESNPLQLGNQVDRRRVSVEVGNFSLLDFFDKNSIIGDLHQSFFSLAFLTHAAWDFNSDARGYSWGAAVEFFWDDWAVRVARVTPPAQPNTLSVSFELWRYYGDQIELEHTHHLFGQEGVVRLLGYRNQIRAGRFADAVADLEANPTHTAANCGELRVEGYASVNPTAPDLCWVRKQNVKLGVGVSVEQHITEDLGVFFRGMYADGQTEVNAYTAADRSLSVGVVGRGSLWSRRADAVGVGFAASWISKEHAEYLRRGGIDGFIGDGSITPGAEMTLDVFYSVNFLSSLWLAVDYQHIVNPAFNQDRGPVDVFSARFHAEF